MCDICETICEKVYEMSNLKNENRKPAGNIQQTTITHLNEMLGVDIMGPLPRSSHGHEYLLVFVDYYYWVELFPLHKATVQTVASHLREEILTRSGVSDFILPDRGTELISAVFQDICTKWKVTQNMTTV